MMAGRDEGIPYPVEHPLFGAALKVARAKKHAVELNARIESYWQSGPIELMREDNHVERKTLIRVIRAAKVPIDLSAVIGDVIHNLRSALDLVASEMVVRGGGNREHAQFPVFDNDSDFNRGLREKRGMRSAPREAIEVARSLQTYRAVENSPLQDIHKLNILDKHRMIIPVALAYSEFLLDPTQSFRQLFSELGFPADTFLFPKLVLAPLDTFAPLKEGEILHSQGWGADGTREELEFKFQVSFEKGQPAEGKAITPTIHEFIAYTQFAMQRFEPLIH